MKYIKNLYESREKVIKYIKNLYESREKVIKFYNDYAKIRSEAKHKLKHGTGLKMLTPKQVF